MWVLWKGKLWVFGGIKTHLQRVRKVCRAWRDQLCFWSISPHASLWVTSPRNKPPSFYVKPENVLPLQHWTLCTLAVQATRLDPHLRLSHCTSVAIYLLRWGNHSTDRASKWQLHPPENSRTILAMLPTFKDILFFRSWALPIVVAQVPEARMWTKPPQKWT